MGSTLGPTMAGLFLALYSNGFTALFLIDRHRVGGEHRAARDHA
jgi:hypothetical protein